MRMTKTKKIAVTAGASLPFHFDNQKFTDAHRRHCGASEKNNY